MKTLDIHERVLCAFIEAPKALKAEFEKWDELNAESKGLAIEDVRWLVGALRNWERDNAFNDEQKKQIAAARSEWRAISPLMEKYLGYAYRDDLEGTE